MSATSNSSNWFGSNGSNANTAGTLLSTNGFNLEADRNSNGSLYGGNDLLASLRASSTTASFQTSPNASKSAETSRLLSLNSSIVDEPISPEDEAAIAEFSPEIRSKLVEVLRRHPEGILGSQLPESYRKIFGEKLILETKKGRKIKLMNILDGHPNARKDTSGILKWFYVPPTEEGSLSQYAAATDAYSRGIEIDILPPEAFPTLSWLRDHDMSMYNWAGNDKEWTEYALRLRPEIALKFEVETEILQAIKSRTACDLSIHSDSLYGQMEKFLVFVKGENNKNLVAMQRAIEFVNQILRSILPSTASKGDDGSDEVYEDDMEEEPVDGGDRVHRTLEIPLNGIPLITGKNNKKLYLLRKKSGAYINLATKVKGKGPAKLTISGIAPHVEAAIMLVKAALTENA